MMLRVLRGPVILPPLSNDARQVRRDAESNAHLGWSSSLATVLRWPWFTAKQQITAAPSIAWSSLSNDGDLADVSGGSIRGAVRHAPSSQRHGRRCSRIHQHGRFAHVSHNRVRFWLAQSFVYCLILLGLFSTCQIHQQASSLNAEATANVPTDLILTVLNKEPSRHINIILIMTSILVGVLYFYSIIRVIQNKCALNPARVASRKPPSRFLTTSTMGWIRPQRLLTDNDDLPLHDTMFAPKIAVRVHHNDDESSSMERGDFAVPDNTAISTSDRFLMPLPTVPPPAYGLWRCSVRADPALLFWQPEGLSRPSSAALMHTRPPSYMSSGEQEEHEVEEGDMPMAQSEHGGWIVV